jgi:group I intron endonuclease
MSKVATVDIYVITCSVTGRVYVGSAKVSRVRLKAHWRELGKGIHINSYLQKAWNKYGSETFSGKVVEVCAVSDRRHREQWWIDFYKAGEPKFGFNLLTTVGKLPDGSVFSKNLKAYWGKRWKDPEYRVKRIAQLRSISKQPGVKARMGASKRANWQDPAYRELQTKRHKEYAAANGEKLSAATKAMWANPEYRKKQLAERRKRFKDPAFRAKLSEAARKRPTRAKLIVSRPACDEIV